MLTHRDPIYGMYEIDGVRERFVRSEGFQRLKEIHRDGAAYLVDDRFDMTRYEHSIGTMLLCMRFGAGTDEQLAALLHDTAHAAFSGIARTVFGRRQQDYHEVVMDRIVEEKGLAALIEDEGFEVDYIMDDENFPMLRQPLPDICADRLDHALRDLNRAGLWSEDDIEVLLDGIEVEQGRLRPSDTDTAWRLMEAFMELNEEVFFDPQLEVADLLLSDLVQEALEKDVLELDDLFETDTHVIEKLDDSELRDKLLDIHPDTPFEQHPDGAWIQHRTFRLVNPVVAGTDRRLSEIDASARERLQRFRQQHDETVRYRIY